MPSWIESISRALGAGAERNLAASPFKQLGESVANAPRPYLPMRTTGSAGNSGAYLPMRIANSAPSAPSVAPSAAPYLPMPLANAPANYDPLSSARMGGNVTPGQAPGQAAVQGQAQTGIGYGALPWTLRVNGQDVPMSAGVYAPQTVQYAAQQQQQAGYGGGAPRGYSVPYGVDPTWYRQFIDEHDGNTPEYVYRRDGDYAIAHALSDKAWGDQFYRTYGRPPSDYDWKASYGQRQASFYGG